MSSFIQFNLISFLIRARQDLGHQICRLGSLTCHSSSHDRRELTPHFHRYQKHDKCRSEIVVPRPTPSPCRVPLPPIFAVVIEAASSKPKRIGERGPPPESSRDAYTHRETQTERDYYNDLVRFKTRIGSVTNGKT